MTDHSLSRFLSDAAGDTDPAETAEWRDALRSLVASQGPARARYILDELAALARDPHIGWSPELVTPYVNTIPVDRQPVFPGDLAIEERLASLMRWNPRSSRPVSTISSAGPMPRAAAISSTSSRTRRPASTRAHSLKEGSRKDSSPTTVRRPAATACPRIPIPG